MLIFPTIRKKTAAGGGGVVTSTFGDGVYADMFGGVRNAAEFVWAGRVKLTANTATNHLAFNSDSSYNSILNFQNNGTIDLRIKDSTGATIVAQFNIEPSTLSLNDEASVFVKCVSGNTECWIDNTSRFTADTSTFTLAKAPRFINTQDGTATDDEGIGFVGGIWYSEASGVAHASTGLDYADLFNTTTQQPTFTTGSVGGFSPTYSYTTPSGFTNDSGTTGTVT